MRDGVFWFERLVFQRPRSTFSPSVRAGKDTCRPSSTPYPARVRHREIRTNKPRFGWHRKYRRPSTVPLFCCKGCGVIAAMMVGISHLNYSSGLYTNANWTAPAYGLTNFRIRLHGFHVSISAHVCVPESNNSTNTSDTAIMFQLGTGVPLLSLPCKVRRTDLAFRKIELDSSPVALGTVDLK